MPLFQTPDVCPQGVRSRSVFQARRLAGNEMSFPMDGPPPGVPAVDVVPLGGLGEFGLNTMAISCQDTTIVIDAG